MGHLSITDRIKIETLLNAGHSISSIADSIGVNRCSIYREIERNSVNGKYCHNAAQKHANKRRQESKSSILTIDNWVFVESLLKQKWSPEQISGYLRLNSSVGFYVSDEWIYQYVRADREKGGDLYKFLRRKGKAYRRGSKREYRGKIKDRRCIETRPTVVNERQRIGDWEVDSVVGAMHKSAIVTIVERVSRYTAILKIASHDAEHVAQAIIERMSADNLPVYTITGDNGNEFARHNKISGALNIDFYFTHPYSSWEKGTNENTNGLIREYFPKGTDFSMVSQEALKKVEDELNKRPRKCLNYKTPAQILKAG